MAAFKEIKVDDLDLQRVQTNVATKFREDDAPVALPVLDIISSSSVTSYTVNPNDVYLVVNARGGPIKIVLPAPNRATQAVKICNAFNATNAVTVATADASKFADGSASIVLRALSSAEMVCDGKAWIRFGVP